MVHNAYVPTRVASVGIWGFLSQTFVFSWFVNFTEELEQCPTIWAFEAIKAANCPPRNFLFDLIQNKQKLRLNPLALLGLSWHFISNLLHKGGFFGSSFQMKTVCTNRSLQKTTYIFSFGKKNNRIFSQRTKHTTRVSPAATRRDLKSTGFAVRTSVTCRYLACICSQQEIKCLQTSLTCHCTNYHLPLLHKRHVNKPGATGIHLQIWLSSKAKKNSHPLFFSQGACTGGSRLIRTKNTRENPWIQVNVELSVIFNPWGIASPSL